MLCDESGKKTLNPGTYHIYIGSSQPDARSRELTGQEVVHFTIRVWYSGKNRPCVIAYTVIECIHLFKTDRYYAACAVSIKEIGEGWKDEKIIDFCITWCGCFAVGKGLLFVHVAKSGLDSHFLSFFVLFFWSILLSLRNTGNLEPFGSRGFLFILTGKIVGMTAQKGTW